MTMREKVARAMRAKDRGGDEWDATDQNDRAVWFSLADAALAAMEVPDEGMVGVALDNYERGPDWRLVHPEDYTQDMTAAFTAAIRHARSKP